MVMNFILWLVLVMGYGLFTWAAEKRCFAKAALCFLDGGYLAFLCLLLLPQGMGTEYFFWAAGTAALGILAAVFMEKRIDLRVLVLAAATGCQFFWQEPFCQREILFLTFLGGMGLYHASSGIIPERVEIGNALFSAAGFLAGTILFVGI